MASWIDVQHEIRSLIHGDRRTVAQGYWAVLRMMRIGQYSKYWNHIRNEAIGGPKWNYDDHIIRVIDMPAASILSLPRLRSTEAEILMAGQENINSMIFAVEAVYKPPLKTLYRPPSIEDLLFFVDKFKGMEPPSPPFIATDRFNITGTLPIHGDNGRLEVVLVIGTRAHGES